MIPELGLGDDQDLECDEAGLEEQEAAHQQAGVTKQMPVAGVRGVAWLSSVHNPIRLVQVLTSDWGLERYRGPSLDSTKVSSSQEQSFK